MGLGELTAQGEREHAQACLETLEGENARLHKELLEAVMLTETIEGQRSVFAKQVIELKQRLAETF